jgi:thiamine-monophosphate kinase
MDISDGLLADAGHLAAASGIGMELQAGLIPLSAAATTAKPSIENIVSGGDDYELLFTAAPKHQARIQEISQFSSTAISCIGRVISSSGVVLMAADGSSISPAKAGYRHF